MDNIIGDKMKKNFLSITFLFIIFLCFTIIIVKQGLIILKVINFEQSDNWKIVEKSNDPIYDKIMSLEVGIENRVNNYFPLYNSINDLYYNTIMNIDSLYLNDIYLKDNRDNERLFYNKKDKFYFVNTKFSKEEINTRVNDYINFYNNIRNKYKDVNIAIYLPLRYELTGIENIDKLNNVVDKFENNLDKNIKLDILKTNNISDYLKYFYKTDHHYNSYGAETAYLSILNMFNKENNLDIKHKNLIKDYRGSAAKSLLVDDIVDTFSVIDINNNLETNMTSKNFKSQKIKDTNNKFYDYYIGYFNGQYDEVIYTNNNSNNNDNLLIISDSFAWQIDYLLANNFKNTYVVNIRFGKWLNNKLNIEDYVKNKNVKYILFLQESKTTLYDGDNVGIKERVI